MAEWGLKFNKGTASVQSVALIVAAASSMRRGRIYEYRIGSDSTPADTAFDLIVQRCTTAGTGSALTPNALDAGDTLASTLVAKDTVTADPTLTSAAFVDGVAFNQRGTVQWQAAPGKELVIPATASNGFIIGLASATVISFQCGMKVSEQ